MGSKKFAFRFRHEEVDILHTSLAIVWMGVLIFFCGQLLVELLRPFRALITSPLLNVGDSPRRLQTNI